ncbi:hypothetical protein STEG23_003903 [Scotinomys teguina]
MVPLGFYPSVPKNGRNPPAVPTLKYEQHQNPVGPDGHQDWPPAVKGILERMTFTTLINIIIAIINTTIIHLDFPMSPTDDQPIAGMWIKSS